LPILWGERRPEGTGHALIGGFVRGKRGGVDVWFVREKRKKPRGSKLDACSTQRGGRFRVKWADQFVGVREGVGHVSF